MRTCSYDWYNYVTTAFNPFKAQPERLSVRFFLLSTLIWRHRWSASYHFLSESILPIPGSSLPIRILRQVLQGGKWSALWAGVKLPLPPSSFTSVVDFPDVLVYRVTSVCLKRPGNVPRLALSAASFDPKITWICIDLRNTRCLQRRLIPAFVWMWVAAFDYSDNINIDLVTKECPTLPVLIVLFRIQHSFALLRIIMQTACDDNVKSTLRIFHGGLNCDIQTAGVVNSQEPYQLRKCVYGDGRKFLDRFKSYFGSQISSQSLNEIHICRLQPKSTAKGECFHIFLSLIVSSSRRMLPFDVWLSFPVTTWTLPL